MTLALVVATAVDGSSAPTAGLVLPASRRTRVFDRLLGQLRGFRLGMRVIARPEFAAGIDETGTTVLTSPDLVQDLREVGQLARRAQAPLLICAGDLIAHDDALASLVNGGGRDTRALVTGRLPATDAASAVRVESGRVVSAGSPYHRVSSPNMAACGVLRVAEADLPQLAKTADELIAFVERAGETGDRRGQDAVTLLLVGLVRAGTPVVAHDIGALHAGRATGTNHAAALARALGDVDEDRVRLDAAVKSDDGFFTTFCVSSYSRYIARWAARIGLSPNAVTCVNLLIACAAAAAFGLGTRMALVAGALLLYVAFVLDCVDGQLARYARKFSKIGGWLDATGDRAKEYIAYAGLAVGSTVAGHGDVWDLAVAAMVLQTLRHVVDFSYNASPRRATPAMAGPSLDRPDDGAGGDDDGSATAGPPLEEENSADPGAAVIRLSERIEKRPLLWWAKKIIVLPIGERFAIIALTAAVAVPRVTFIALLAWGGLAACYSLSGRVLRSLMR